MKALIVCTGKRGVFFGYGTPSQPEIRLERARMCVYWSEDVKGILGLAADGPTQNCRITAEVPAITLNDVTAIIETSDKAVKAWQAQPWK